MFTVFISYRRDPGGTFALLLEEKLKQRGFSVFLDHKAMHQGRFDLEIMQAIDEIKDFVVLLSKDCFVPHGAEDYFFSEIGYALKKKKNIVPIFLNGYDDLNTPPEAIADVLKYQGITEQDPQDFETVFIPKLISYLSDTDEKQNYLEEIGVRSYLSSRRKIEMEPLDLRWKDAVEIDICAYFANMLINSQYITQALSKGIHIKYLVVDPDSEAAIEAVRYRLRRIRMNRFKQSYDAAVELLYDMKDEQEHYFDGSIANGELEVRKTTLFIGQAIMIVKKKKESESTVKVDFYTFDTDDANRRSVLISAADRENYDFFCRQFDYIWEAPETQQVIAE